MEGSLVSESAKKSNMLLKKKLRKILKSRKSTIWIVSVPEREKRGKKGKKIKMTRKYSQIKIPISRSQGVIGARKMTES